MFLVSKKEVEKLRKENKELRELCKMQQRQISRHNIKNELFGDSNDEVLQEEIARLREELDAVIKERDWLKQMSSKIFETAKKEKVKKNS